MPLVDTPAGSPFPLVEDVMNLARVRVNDAMNDISGDLLSDDAPYTPTILNSAWRWLQSRYATGGGEPFIREYDISSFPVAASQDIVNQASINWQGCNDGVYQYESPALPQDLINPLSMWRRNSINAGTVGGSFQLMRLAQDGLPRYFDPTVYDWREDGIYFYATSQTQDFKLRYSAFRAALMLSDPTSQVPMMMCEDCLSARIAYEYASLRGAAAAPRMMQLAEDAFAVILQRTTRRQQRKQIRRSPFNCNRNDQRWGWPAISNT
jgi:hypothetical protein